MKKLRIAGIGSRETPLPVLTEMETITYDLVETGHMIISGGAPGADTAFQRGAYKAISAQYPKDTDYEINQVLAKYLAVILPWNKFNDNNKHISFHNEDCFPHLHIFSDMSLELKEEAYKIMRQFHPAYTRLSDSAMKLMARNGFQVLGHDLKHPVDLVICYTVDGKFSGGTGQSLRIADAHHIPIINLKNQKFSMDFIHQLEEN